MSRRNLNPAALFALLTISAMAVVFWATWSALPHHQSTASVAQTTKVLPVELLSLLCWTITAAYGAWIAATGRKYRGLPRNLSGRAIRLAGAGELVLSLGALWAILAQPASTFLYSFAVLLGIFTVAIGAALAMRGRGGSRTSA